MKIAIIGGAGRVGRAVYNEALRRGDEPTAVVRDLGRAEGVLGEFGVYLVKDALALTASDLASFDAVVVAFNTAPTKAAQHLELAKRLIEAGRQQPGPRLLFVLGAGSLRKGERLYLDELYETQGTSSWIACPEQQTRELAFLRTVQDVDWVGVSPSEELVVGPAQAPVLGVDDVLVGPGGASRVSTGTLAVAILDELHTPAHPRARFTVRDEAC